MTTKACLASLLAAAGLLGSCSEPNKTLSSADRRVCVAEGGFESRGPFGYPICQLRYADAGKSCSDKSECSGRCILDVAGSPSDPLPQPGQTAVGKCEPARSTFGCFATIVGGKISPEGAICVD
jgi:hypothetical protein